MKYEEALVLARMYSTAFDVPARAVLALQCDTRIISICVDGKKPIEKYKETLKNSEFKVVFDGELGIDELPSFLTYNEEWFVETNSGTMLATVNAVLQDAKENFRDIDRTPERVHNEAKPCPVCGRHPVFSYTYDTPNMPGQYGYIYCMNGCKSTTIGTIAEAIDSWNN